MHRQQNRTPLIMKSSFKALLGILLSAGALTSLHAQDGTALTNGLTVTVTFDETGSDQSFTVPDGITNISFDLLGASGGNAGAFYGGSGAELQGTLSVTGGETLYIFVGGFGLNPSQMNPNYGNYQGGGYNGGGGGYIRWPSGGGGGATDIRIGGTDLTNRVAVAGGGGGSQNNAGSAGTGGDTGQYNDILGVGSDGQYGGGGGGYYGGESSLNLPFNSYNSGKGGSSWFDSSVVSAATSISGTNGSSSTSEQNGVATLTYAVPEPSTYALLGLGTLAVVVASRRSRIIDRN
jgi:hypothetical protein